MTEALFFSIPYIEEHNNPPNELLLNARVNQIIFSSFAK